MTTRLWDAPTADKNMVEAVVPDEFADGIRLDAFLAQTFPDKSRAFFQKCIEFEKVYLNGRVVKKASKVLPGNVIEIDWPDTGREDEIKPENIPLDIMYEDQDMLVINKPAGLVVHPAQGNYTGTLVHGLLYHDEDAFEDMMDEDKRPGIVHRLDKDTSGTLVVAKTPEACACLKETFKIHDLEKIYLAIVKGIPEKRTGSIHQPIGRHPTNRQRMAVTPDGKDALSLYKVIAESQGHSLLKVKILTGRTHQIRVHMAFNGTPIIGDPFYGPRHDDLVPTPGRQMLHAWKLTIPHPRTREAMTFQAPIPSDFLMTLAELGLPNPEQDMTGYPPQA